MSERFDSIDAEIVRVQRSTRTLFPTFTKAHNWLRMKSQTYYRWHMSPLHTAVHVFVLLAYTTSATALTYDLATDIRPVHASSPTLYDLTDSTNFNVRLDGAASGDNFGIKGFTTGDFNGNGKADLVIGASSTDYNSRTNSGSVYIVLDFETRNFSGTGNTLDFSDSGAYHLRFDGPQASAFNSIADFDVSAVASDYNGDNKDDLVVVMATADFGTTNSGSTYLIANEIITAASGTGNTFDMADSGSYSIRIDGLAASDIVGGINSLQKLADIDGDGKSDLIVNAPGMDNNASVTGSSYIISSTILDDFSGRGNTLDLSDSSKYSIRYDGEATAWSLGLGQMLVTDVDGNGQNDLVMGDAFADTRAAVASNNTGAVYIVNDSLLQSYTGTGNIVNLATNSNYSLRIDGAAALHALAQYSLTMGDLDGDGKPEMAVGSITATYNGRSPESGSIWIINGTALSVSTTGNKLDLNDPSHFAIRIDGAAVGDRLGYGVAIGDFHNDGKNDLLVVAARADNNSRTDSGSGYLFDGSLIRNYTGTGNLVDLADTSKYSFRWDAATGDRVVTAFENFTDLNGDGLGDLWFNTIFADNNARTDSGSVYVWFTFPHTIATPTVAGETSAAGRTVSGSVSAASSTTVINTVQASINTSGFEGTWSDCTATDGAFDSKTENYSCNLTLPSEGTHTIRIRAKDSNGVYTPTRKYTSVQSVYELPASPEPSPTPTPSPEPDTTAPNLTLKTIGNTKVRNKLQFFTYYSTKPRPVFAGTSEAGAKIRVATGETELCQTSVGDTGKWSCKSSLLELKDYKVTIIATDAAGNTTTLPNFTLRTALPTETPTPTATSEASSTPTPTTDVVIDSDSNIGNQTGFKPFAYTATVQKVGSTVQLNQFKVRLLDSKNQPLAHTKVILHSEPQTQTTDAQGIATFSNVPVGQHTLIYVYKGKEVRRPVNVVLADTITGELEDATSVPVTLSPMEIQLPVNGFGRDSWLWLTSLIILVGLGGLLAIRRAYQLSPHWKTITTPHHQSHDELKSAIQKMDRLIHPNKSTLHTLATKLRVQLDLLVGRFFSPRRRILRTVLSSIYALMLIWLAFQLWRSI